MEPDNSLMRLSVASCYRQLQDKQVRCCAQYVTLRVTSNGSLYLHTTFACQEGAGPTMVCASQQLLDHASQTVIARADLRE